MMMFRDLMYDIEFIKTYAKKVCDNDLADEEVILNAVHKQAESLAIEWFARLSEKDLSEEDLVKITGLKPRDVRKYKEIYEVRKFFKEQ